MLSKIVLGIFVILSFSFSSVYAVEPILITSSGVADKIIFDGKWSDNLEWKTSSYDQFHFADDNSKIVLRSAHQDDFIYIQINAVSDFTLDKGSDSATLCFDSKNDKSSISKNDDYCFFTTLNGKNSFTYQGGSPVSLNGNFKKIQNHKDYIAIGNVSGKYDRYDAKPHPTYEFKIPIDLLGRSDNYGFYFSTFDANSYKKYSWPKQLDTSSPLKIPSPSQWGDIISPDKSLPEFNYSIFLLFIIPIFLITSFITKNRISKVYFH
ncbi:hypothetical protein [Nitrosopumilus adriaticus]|uniref:Carbohydrate-binding domain-containing protein n=1 Tax=Nitrosopumilus adriaticus TaxID=1580092 RepID=A0A0D5C054_9ARCH|nr:hypothetical protein [Nitrosopumilus adriaticus]AJW69705.1 conserved exported protein of unknown function [Nitrosopumilus adriaticus]